MLLGDEAIARGAMDAGLSGIYAYPGTPSTEIAEYVHAAVRRGENGVLARWTANEKTAVESALGMSYAGKRSMCCMKHVGLNVAADPFMNSAITGVNGGLVIAVADDPSMHSSQNEQDSRFFGKFANIPVLEPSDQQEAYDMAYGAFGLSEKYQVPVMIRITTRLAHSRSGVRRSKSRPGNRLALPARPLQFILLPSMARESYRQLVDKQADFEKEAGSGPYNRYTGGTDRSLGIIACGIAYNYLMENFPERSELPHPVVKIAQYPVPRDLIRSLAAEVEEILVLEEGYPLIEELLQGILDHGKTVHGRLDGRLPRTGELNPGLVAVALGLSRTEGLPVPDVVKKRPPALCKGCGHADLFKALNQAMEVHGRGKVFSDIGCYTLGAYPPYESIYTCVDMGASVTMAKGAADAGLSPVVCVIGDSTFTHSGMTGLLDAVQDDTAMTVIISDNATTAMTGGQPSAADGVLVELCRGLGVAGEHIRVIRPHHKDHDKNVRSLEQEISHPGLSVVIARRGCVREKTKKSLNH